MDGGHAMSPTYYNNASGLGPARHGQLTGSIAVLQARDNHLRIRIASEIGRTEDCLTGWILHFHGADVPGRRVIVDREFKKASRELMGEVDPK